MNAQLYLGVTIMSDNDADFIGTPAVNNKPNIELLVPDWVDGEADTGLDDESAERWTPEIDDDCKQGKLILGDQM